VASRRKATAVKARRRRCLVRGLLRRGEFNADVNGFNAIKDGGGFKRGFKGGKMKARW
jgi:hypothetical protein